ncbi:hypothetical protein Tco_0392415 [Tanacetum coccineum]
MKQAFVDYNITIDEVPILCDDKCAINLTSSPVDYPKTKHIKIRHHFLKDNTAKNHITIDKTPLGENVANSLTKPLEKDQFSYLRLGLGLIFDDIKSLIMEYLVKISKKARILELKWIHLNISVLTSYTPYPSRKIQRICAYTSQKTTKEQDPIRRIQRSPYVVFKL